MARGALNTARHALELSRVVAAYPGSVYSASSAGTNRLIRLREADLVTGAPDVLDLVRPEEPPLGDLGGSATGDSSRAGGVLERAAAMTGSTTSANGSGSASTRSRRRKPSMSARLRPERA